MLDELQHERHRGPDVLHVQALGLFDERGWHREEHDLGVEVAGAVVGVAAGDARGVHLLDDGGHHVEPADGEAVVLVGLRICSANNTAPNLDDALLRTRLARSHRRHVWESFLVGKLGVGVCGGGVGVCCVLSLACAEG